MNNPRVFRRATMPMVKCHGLLRCQNNQCSNDSKLWNRDLTAVLNFKHILTSLRGTGPCPARFKRTLPRVKRSGSFFYLTIGPKSKENTTK
ncbi:hypothetical protein AB4K20DRAFT_1914567 [Rhizopus microsporus]